MKNVSYNAIDLIHILTNCFKTYLYIHDIVEHYIHRMDNWYKPLAKSYYETYNIKISYNILVCD